MGHKATGPYTTIKFTGRSDGDETHRPSNIEARGWSRMDPELYLTKIAQKYEEEKGMAVSGLSSPPWLIMSLTLDLSNEIIAKARHAQEHDIDSTSSLRAMRCGADHARTEGYECHASCFIKTQLTPAVLA